MALRCSLTAACSSACDELLSTQGSLSLNLDTLIDTENNGGNKPIFGTGLQRLQAFSKWAMDRPEEVIIVAGHSLWFRHFFRTYLAGAELSELAQEAKDLKMCNGGAVAFTLEVRFWWYCGGACDPVRSSKGTRLLIP